MKKLYLIWIVLLHQIGVAQVNVNIEIDTEKLTSLKLSEIADRDRSVTLKIDSIVDVKATDRFLFVSTGPYLAGEKLHQFDLSGNLIRTYTFTNENKRFRFICDSETNRLILFNSELMTVWDMNGKFLKTVRLPEGNNESANSVFGFAQNYVWTLQQKNQGSIYQCRINRINIENEKTETILERDFNNPTQRQGLVVMNISHSSFGGKSYIGFRANEIYEITGIQAKPVIKYTYRNYREDPLNRFREGMNEGFTGRYFYLDLVENINSRTLFWYDTKEKRTWQVQEKSAGKGGIEDDIFRTGTCDYYLINGNYLIFRKKGGDLPMAMNIEKNHTIVFITKLKQ